MATKHHTAPSRRSYRSDLREAQARATRERILDAVGALLKTRPDQVSYAAIARAARVALPTVHRHFPTRKELFEAYRLRVEGATTASDRAVVQSATTLDRIAPHVKAFFRRFDDPSDPMFGMRRLRPSLAWEFSREVTVPRRQEWAAAIIDAHCPGLSVVDRQRFSDLVVVLVSSSLGEAMVGYLGRSGAETADRVQWALEALLTQAVSSARTAGTSATSRRSRRVARWR